MKRILMVCLGNICRSPMAEGILRQHAPDTWHIDSAGTAAYHVGEPPDPRARATMKKNGLNIQSLRGRQFQVSDFDDFDLIYVMDHSNLNNVLALAPNDEARAKVQLLLNEAFPGENREVPDPYYGGDEGFDQVFDMLTRSAKAIVARHG